MMLVPVEPSTSSEADREFGNAFIRKLSGFGLLSDSDLAALAMLSGRSHSVERHTDLVRHGDAPDGAIIILEGFACRYRSLADGRRQIVAFLLPGDLCDLDSACLGRMDHAIGTLTDCRVVRVASDALVNLSEEHPRVASALRMTKRAEEVTSRDWLVGIGRRTAPERLAHLLCELLVRMRAVGLASSDSCDLPITQSELGDATGLSTVHVNRSLQALRAASLIQFGNRKLRVIDLRGLCSFCDFSRLHGHDGASHAAHVEPA